MREAAKICPRPGKLTFDFLTLKVVSESRLMWANSVPILVFLGLSVVDLGPMYATDKRQRDRQTSDVHHRLMSPTLGHNKNTHTFTNSALYISTDMHVLKFTIGEWRDLKGLKDSKSLLTA